jgi:hypothetical protein
MLHPRFTPVPANYFSARRLSLLLPLLLLGIIVPAMLPLRHTSAQRKDRAPAADTMPEADASSPTQARELAPDGMTPAITRRRAIAAPPGAKAGAGQNGATKNASHNARVAALAGATEVAATAANITWRAADNPHVVNGTYTIPAGTTVTMEPGVVVQINADSALVVAGTLIGQGTAANHIRITGASNYSSDINVTGRLELNYTDITAQTDPQSGGTLLFTNCRWHSSGSFYSPISYTYTDPPYVEFQHCTFDGPNVSATLTDLTLVLRDVSLTGGAYLRAYYAYVYLDNVRSDNSIAYGLQFFLDGQLYIDNVQIRNAGWAALYLGGGNYGGNFALGATNVLAGNQYPVSLENGGLLPGSVVPTTGNTNNYVHAEAPQGAVDWRGPITWAPLAVPYVITDPLNIAGAWRMLPGTRVLLGPNFSGISDQTASLAIRGTPTAPVRFGRLDAAQPWGGIGYQTGGQRIAHAIFDGAASGLSTTTHNGSFVYGHDLVLRNATSTGAHGNTILIATQFLNNAVGYHGSGILNGAPASPNSFVGNTVGVRSESGSTVEARHNWWNSPSGPRYERNPGGTGDPIEGSAEFIPYLTAPPDYTSDTPPVVRQHRPGFSYDAGARLAISWDAEDDHGIVGHRILFSPAGNYPTTFQTIVDNLPASTRAYEWTVPAIGFQTTYGTSTIRVVSIDSAGHERFDDQMIQIPSGEVQCSLTITSNLAGRTLRPGENFPVTWTAGACNESLVDAFLLLENDGRTYPLGGAAVNLGTLGGQGFAPYVSTDRARLLLKVNSSRNRAKYFYGAHFQIRPDARLGDAAPVVALQTPQAGARYAAGSIVPITWTASDDESLRAFHIHVSYDGGTNWTAVAADLPGTARSYDLHTAPGSGFGDVRVKVIAVDLRFQQTTDGAARSFSLTRGTPPNVRPSVRLTHPTPESIFLANSNVILRADASDTDGSVTQVDFYTGSTLIGTDTAAPYEINWNNAPAGTHSLTAHATDNGGDTSASAPVGVVVRAAAPPAPLPGTAWGATYNGASNGNDSSPIMTLDAQGNLYLTGGSTGIGTDTDITTIKYDAAGNEQWVARFNGTGNGADVPYKLAVDGAGNVFVIGSTWRRYNFDGGFETDWVALKYDAAGNLLWTRHYSGTQAQSFTDRPSDLKLDGAGNLYVTGYSQYNGYNNFLVGYATTIKYDTNGNQLWARTYDTADRWGASGAGVDVDAEGNVYVAGTVRVATVNANTTDENVLTLKYDAAGTLLWARQYDQPGSALSDFDQGKRIRFDHGSIYVLGSNKPDGSEYDLLLLKYDAAGNFQDAANWTSEGMSDYPGAWDFDAAGNIYLTGTSDSQAEYGVVFTLKFDSSFDLKWARFFDGPITNGYDAGYDLTLDGRGGLYVAGPSLGADQDYDFLLLRYLTDGSEAGANRYEGAAGLDDVPQTVKLDAAGNLYVSGDTRTTRGDLDFLTIRIAASAAAPPAARAGDIFISEFRTRGAGGSEDEFVELYNRTDAPVTIRTTDGTAGWAIVALDDAGASATTIHVIPNGTSIPARGHYLIAGSNYTLGALAAPDASYNAPGIPDNRGLALFTSATNYFADNRLDAVGFNEGAGALADMMREGAGLPSLTFDAAAAAPPPEWSFVRRLASGWPADTDNNADDFMLVSTTGATFGAPASVLGAPGPESSASASQRNGHLKASLIDPQTPSAFAPNRARIGTPVPNGQYGTFVIRRRFTNKTGASVTRLRFRIVDITTYPRPNTATADLRVINSPDTEVTLTTADGRTTNLIVKGTSLESSLAQPLGGGINSTVTVALPGGALAPNNSVNVQFVMGVEQPGGFRFIVNVEALTSPVAEEGLTGKSRRAGKDL